MKGSIEDPMNADDPFEDQSGEGPDIKAATELGRKAARVRSIVAWPCILIGVLMGIPGYLVVREIQFRTLGMNVAYVSAFAGFLPPLAAGIFVARFVSRRLIRARAKAWVAEVAGRYGVSRELLTDITQYWD
jgi:hypothetical protein